jgi:hypothetical protein
MFDESAFFFMTDETFLLREIEAILIDSKPRVVDFE